MEDFGSMIVALPSWLQIAATFLLVSGSVGLGIWGRLKKDKTTTLDTDTVERLIELLKDNNELMGKIAEGTEGTFEILKEVRDDNKTERRLIEMESRLRREIELQRIEK